MANSVVTINNLVKRFPGGGDFFTALKNVNLTLGKGEFTGLVGPSGSGKPTLLNVIGGLDSPSSGSVTVLSKSLADTSHMNALNCAGKIWVLFSKATIFFLFTQCLKMWSYR